MKQSEIKFIDWQKIFSYDALLTMVTGARGRGKTYGLRKQFVYDFINNGYRFVEVCRYKAQIKEVQSGYFDALIRDDVFPDYQFKCEGGKAYIAPKTVEVDEEGKQKPAWQLLGYFVALSDYQNIKKRTFANVKRLVLDEAIIERLDVHHRYLPNEWVILQSVVDSTLREKPNENRGRIYLLSNACDLVNPYFVALGISVAPKFGFTWYNNKRFLLYYEKPNEYAQLKRDYTLAGVMGDYAGDVATSLNNEFQNANMDFVAEKTKNANFEFGVTYMGQEYGIWSDYNEGYYYVNRKIPKNTNKTVFALTARDNRANLVVAKRAENALKMFSEVFYLQMVRYDSPGTREQFIEILNMFGVR